MQLLLCGLIPGVGLGLLLDELLHFGLNPLELLIIFLLLLGAAFHVGLYLGRLQGMLMVAVGECPYKNQNRKPKDNLDQDVG